MRRCKSCHVPYEACKSSFRGFEDYNTGETSATFQALAGVCAMAGTLEAKLGAVDINRPGTRGIAKWLKARDFDSRILCAGSNPAALTIMGAHGCGKEYSSSTLDALRGSW